VATSTSVRAALLPWQLRQWQWQVHPRYLRLIFLCLDGLAALAAFVIANWLWTFTSDRPFSLSDKPWWLYWILPAWLLLTTSLYDPRHAARRRATLMTLIVSAGVAMLGYVFVFFLAPPDTLPRLVIFYFVVLSAFFAAVLRLPTLTVITSKPFQRRALLVGAASKCEVVAKTFAESRVDAHAIVGIISDDDSAPAAVSGIPVLDQPENLFHYAVSQNITEIILATGNEISPALFQSLLNCRGCGIEITRMHNFYEQITGRIPINYLHNDWALASFVESSAGMITRLYSRALDVLLSAIGLALYAAAYPFIALAILMDGGLPILYHQPRLGRGGAIINLVKFRTMVKDAEQDGQVRWAALHDPRVTRVGRFLRRTRLDEIPQFWNVFKGEMSLIGPRPERPEFFAMLEDQVPFYRARLLVKPGLTGWAQINYHYGSSVEDAAIKLQYDLYYIKNRSFWLDVLILWHTLKTIAQMSGT
jgi:exopolysaccharide biosynthesis polyprenyl glycosylphosphotransferase